MAKKNDDLKNQAHIMLQGKGGVGKSLVSAILAQYLMQENSVTCIDTDPINQTFMQYKGLDAQHLELLDGSKINERNFDLLMEDLLTKKGLFVVDNGASSFVPLSSYLIENDALEMIKDTGKDVYIHSVITGGQAILDTLTGFKVLAEQIGKDIKLVVWLNEYFGEVQYDGKEFTEMQVYLNNKEKVVGLVRIAQRNKDTFGKDVEHMCSHKMTFKEAIHSETFNIMSKQRLKVVQSDLYSQLATILS